MAAVVPVVGAFLPAVVVVAFVLVAGFVIYSNTAHGGKNVTLSATVTHADTMKPSELDAHQNDVVTINITSDTTGEVHLHGYDIEKQVMPGEVTEMSFTARATGRFTVEPHLEQLPSGGHAHGDALVTIEVYP